MTEKGLLWNRFGFKSGMKCSTIYRNPLNARNGLFTPVKNCGTICGRSKNRIRKGEMDDRVKLDPLIGELVRFKLSALT